MSPTLPLLARYVLREVLQQFFVVATALTCLLLVFGIGKEALEHGLGMRQVLQLFPYVLPKALLFSVPATILFAVTSVFGRMSAAGEIVALKALGVSPTGVLLPVFGLAVVLSVVTFWLNDVSFSWGDQGVNQTVINAVEEIAYSVLRTKRSFHSPQFSVIVKSVEARRLISPTFRFHAPGREPITVRAAEAELQSRPGSGVLTIICRNGTVDLGHTTFDFSDTFEREIPLFDPDRDPLAGESPSHLPVRLLPERETRQLAKIERLEQQQSATAAFCLAGGDYLKLTGPEFAEQARLLQEARWDLYRVRLEPPRRWANGFSCLCFALVGAPIAILLRFADTWATFFICFLPILLVYYPLMMYAVDRAKAGAMPPVAVWLGNVILALFGLWFLRRVYRY